MIRNYRTKRGWLRVDTTCNQRRRSQYKESQYAFIIIKTAGFNSPLIFRRFHFTKRCFKILDPCSRGGGNLALILNFPSVPCNLLKLFNFRRILSGRNGQYFEQYEDGMKSCEANPCIIYQSVFGSVLFFEGEGTGKSILFLIRINTWNRVFREVFSSRDLKSFRYLIFHLASIDTKDRDINYDLSRDRVKYYLYKIFYFSFILFPLLFFSICFS